VDLTAACSELTAPFERGWDQAVVLSGRFLENRPALQEPLGFRTNGQVWRVRSCVSAQTIERIRVSGSSSALVAAGAFWRILRAASRRINDPRSRPLFIAMGAEAVKPVLLARFSVCLGQDAPNAGSGNEMKSAIRQQVIRGTVFIP
jgi:hypothetical protein